MIDYSQAFRTVFINLWKTESNVLYKESVRTAL